MRRGSGGERGIRTLGTLLRYTRLAGVRLRPLGHLSNDMRRIENYGIDGRHGQTFASKEVNERGFAPGPQASEM